jgi:hypothetical protein
MVDIGVMRTRRVAHCCAQRRSTKLGKINVFACLSWIYRPELAYRGLKEDWISPGEWLLPAAVRDPVSRWRSRPALIQNVVAGPAHTEAAPFDVLGNGPARVLSKP